MSGLMHSVVLRRREDFLALTVHVYGFAPRGVGAHTVLSRREPDARIVLELPPQHLLEGVTPAPSTVPGYPDSIADGALSGPSRISRRVPDDVVEIPYTAQALLDLASWPLAVPPAAARDADEAASVRPPEDDETALEMPWRLLLAPPAEAGFAHASDPVTRDGRTEVWHARLGLRAQAADGAWTVHEYVPEVAEGARSVRAVWSWDDGLQDFLDGGALPPHPGIGLPFGHAVPRAHERAQIVYATSFRGNPEWVPGPVDVDQLTVSSAGGWLAGRLTADLPVPTNPDVPLDLESWTHRSTMGRDQYVRLVTRGYCAPTGHRFAAVEVVERRTDPKTSLAVLVKTLTLVCRNPLRTFDWPPGVDPAVVRRLPFRRIRLTTLVSPPLDQQPGGNPGDFWAATVNGAPFAFSAMGTDLDGREVPLAIPMIFVRATKAFDPAVAEQVADTWNDWAAAHGHPIGRIPTFGRRLAFAPAKVRGDGSTSLETAFLTLGMTPVSGYVEQTWRSADVPPFVPHVESAEVALAAAQSLAATPLGTAQIEYDGQYAQQGFARAGATPAQRAAEVFAVLTQPVPLVMAGAKAGALAVPNLRITGLSRELGPVGPLTPEGFDPAAVFAGLGAELLGAVPLASVVARETGAVTQAPRIVRQEIRGPDGSPSAILVRFSWRARLVRDPAGILEPHGPDTSVTLRGWSRTELGPAAPTYEMTGETGGFDLNFFGAGASRCVTVAVERLVFHSGAGRPAVLEPQIGAVTFVGPLRFVEKLKDYVSFGGNGPYVDVSMHRILAGVALSLPSIQVGVFSLADLAVRTELEVSLTGEAARLRFAICTRAQPFRLTVALFGGGGFFALEVSTAGLELVEAALEFGAACSVNLGVASGSVSIMAGIYLKLEKKDGGTSTTLEGFFRLNGEMSVLGLISLSIELYLSLRYVEYPDGTNKVVGRATVHVEVEVFLFSASVEVTCERRLGGTANDPTFADQVSSADWEEYCAAFAPMPA